MRCSTPSVARQERQFELAPEMTDHGEGATHRAPPAFMRRTARQSDEARRANTLYAVTLVGARPPEKRADEVKSCERRADDVYRWQIGICGRGHGIDPRGTPKTRAHQTTAMPMSGPSPWSVGRPLKQPAISWASSSVNTQFSNQFIYDEPYRPMIRALLHVQENNR